ncbi:hypothetical protein DH09_08520 [Bacillaceae bacterium JMAK1]|nr:hypothetical protein DH09_08520 [Bacillaceae bacterium JMAK1]
MTTDQLQAYLREVHPRINEDELLQEMERHATEHHVPIIDLESARFLQQLIALKGATRILELGTAIGYSAITMALASADGTVTTFERDETRIRDARTFLQKSATKERIELIEGDAFERIEQLQGSYDFLFVDASKGHNIRFVETFSPYLKRGGLMVVDNVLFKGWTYEPSEAPKRLQPLAKKMASFNKWLLLHPQFQTTIHPIGDGMAVAIKQ